MSAEVYARGLWLNGDCLVLKDEGLTVQLRHAAPIKGLSEVDFGEVDRGTNAYFPEIRHDDGEPRREMEGPEIVALKERINVAHAVIVAALEALLRSMP